MAHPISRQTRLFYEFGPFRLDTEKRVLVHEGTPVSLTPKAAETLVVLVENAGHLVDKDDLMKRVWPQVFVQEVNLNKNIFFLRKVLGQWGGGREYIETVPKRGFRFVAPVSEVTHAEHAAHPRASAGVSLVGKRVLHYRVLEVLGGGGMGLVYQAEDLKLGRPVALKFLPEEVANDSLALQRFEREARTASSLNHPNICTIHGIEEHQGQPFIVMELLEGENLRDLISKGGSSGGDASPLPLDRLLDIAVQISDGLGAAHQKGIIHRDIKPANVFITSRGQVKILDFGVAKLSEATREVEVEELRGSPSGISAETVGASTVEHSLTQSGTAIGTVAYMSPEQVRGETPDVRTDLFSFGLILYEMATGQRAVRGNTASVLRDAILTRKPIPLRYFNSKLPPELEPIIDRALAKDRELRYPSAMAMRADLQSLALRFSTPVGLTSNEHPGGWRLVATALGFLLTVAVMHLMVRRPAPPPLGLKQTQLTANSSANPVDSGAISRDGKYLSYSDKHGMHIKLLETGEVQDVPEPEALKGFHTEWELFPLSDTSFLANAFVGGKGDSAWTVSVMGGQPRKLLDNAFPNSASPDGSMIAFLKNPGKVGFREIWLTDSLGQQLRRAYQTDENSNLQTIEWAPDGQRLAYWKEHRAKGKLEVSIETRPLNGGPSTTLISDPRLWQFVWLRDGRLIYSLSEPDINQASCNFWSLRVDSRTGRPEGAPIQVTNWAGFCTGDLSASRDSKRLVTYKWWNQRSVYVGDYGRKATLRPRRLTLSDGQEYPVGWTVDSKSIVFVSNRNGMWGIFKQSLNKESAETIITGLTRRVDARLSPGGSWIVYQVFTGWEEGQVMRVPVTGGPSEQVLTLITPPEPIPFSGVHLHEPPRCSTLPVDLCAIAERTVDGKQLVFTGFHPVKGRGRELARFDIDPAGAYKWDLSPDGKKIAVLKRSENRVHILSLVGMRERLITIKGWQRLETVGWTANGKGLFISDAKETSSVLLRVDLRGNSEVLWEQSGEQEGNNDIYAIPSADGRHLAMYGWTRNSNIWMLENF